MDLRIQRTKAAIKKAFLQLRSQKPIEKITVTELTKLANINKATFYLHYSDIYALSDELEDSLIDEVLTGLKVQENFFDNPQQYALEIFKALVAHRDEIDCVFSGGRFALASDKIEARIKAALFDSSPAYKTRKNEIIVTFLIQGLFHSVKTPRMSGDMREELAQLSQLTTLVISQIERPTANEQ